MRCVVGNRWIGGCLTLVELCNAMHPSRSPFQTSIVPADPTPTILHTNILNPRQHSNPRPLHRRPPLNALRLACDSRFLDNLPPRRNVHLPFLQIPDPARRDEQQALDVLALRDPRPLHLRRSRARHAGQPDCEEPRRDQLHHSRARVRQTRHPHRQFAAAARLAGWHADRRFEITGLQ